MTATTIVHVVPEEVVPEETPISVSSTTDTVIVQAPAATVDPPADDASVIVRVPYSSPDTGTVTQECE